jgi:phosphonopyruvate decarboxylase
MIDTKKLLIFLEKNNLNFFSGVPDSVLKNFTNLLINKSSHVLATNEGSAVSIGIGYHLSFNKLPCIYMQNSGLANAINPLISIAHKGVYSIPMMMLIGWRGSPGIKDEPQHLIKGKITKNLLKLLGIKYEIIESEKDFNKIKKLINFSKKKKVPVACLFKKGVLKKVNYHKKFSERSTIKNKILRSEVIREILKSIQNNTKIISTTGYTSRELYQIRKNEGYHKGKDFYMIGGMGHSSSVALGAAFKKNKKILCLDGDGSMLMHLGSLHTVGLMNKNNFKHILLNNQSHESVGGQEISFKRVKMEKLIKGLGYSKYIQLKDKKDLKNKIQSVLKYKGSIFLEVLIEKGAIKNLGRPKNFIKIKNNFLKN